MVWVENRTLNRFSMFADPNACACLHVHQRNQIKLLLLFAFPKVIRLNLPPPFEFSSIKLSFAMLATEMHGFGTKIIKLPSL